MAKNWRKLLVIWALVLSTAIPVFAHTLGLARVELQEQYPARYTLKVNLPASSEFLSGEPKLPSRCQFEKFPLTIQRPGILVRQFEFTCNGQPLKLGDSLHLPWKRSGAFVLATWLDGSTSQESFAPVAGQSEKGTDITLDNLKPETLSPIDVLKRYFFLGLKYILTAWETLAFLLCLCFIAVRQSLIRLVTGFSLASGLSVTLGTLHLIPIPSPLLAACIALSLAFIAREVLLPSENQVRLVFAFGLLHGLGFANALNKVTPRASELPLGLLTFNFGLVTGQLLFLATVISLMLWGRKLPKHHLIRQIIAYLLGILGVFLTLKLLGSFS